MSDEIVDNVNRRIEQIISKEDNNHDKIIVLTQQLKATMVLYEHKKQSYEELFAFWNNKYPDEMQEFLNQE